MRNVFRTVSTGLAIAAGTHLAFSADRPTAFKSDTLQVGQPVPGLECTDDEGKSWNSKDYVGCRILVLYFYPGDFTGGCIEQAKAFREQLKQLGELGVDVVGISGDAVNTHRLFKESHGLKHTLLTDPQGAIAERLGIPVQREPHAVKVRTRNLSGEPIMDQHGKSIIVHRNVTLARWTVVIGRDGRLLSKRADVNPPTDADEVRKLVEGLSCN